MPHWYQQIDRQSQYQGMVGSVVATLSLVGTRLAQQRRIHRWHGRLSGALEDWFLQTDRTGWIVKRADSSITGVTEGCR